MVNPSLGDLENNVLHFIKTLIVAICLCLSLPAPAASESHPIAVDGVLDLRDWSFQQNGTVSLSGVWRVAWQDFKTESGEVNLVTQYPSTIKMPGQWATSSKKPSKNQEATAGSATYALDVLLPNNVNTADLAIHTSSANPATHWTIFEAGETKVLGQMRQGVAGQTLESTTPRWTSASTALSTSNSKHIRIQIHASNFRYPTAGFNDAPELGLQKSIKQKEVSRLFLNSLTLGILIIIGWYHFVVYLQRREDKASLAFSLWCATFVLRTIVTARFPQIFGIDTGPNDFALLVALEFISIPLTVLGCAYFLYALVPTEVSKKLLVGSGLTSFALIVMTLTTPMFFFASYLVIYQLHMLGSAIVFFGFLFSQIKNPETQARWVLLAFSILLFGAANDILHSQNMIHSRFIVHYAFIAFVFLQSAILSGKFAKTYQEAAHLSRNLQQEVAVQTASLIQTSNREIEHAKTLLNQSEKLSQLGVMIASIGHEIVNPVSVISNSLNIQQETTLNLKNHLMQNGSEALPEELDTKDIDKSFERLRITHKACRTSVEKLLEMTHALGTQSRQEVIPVHGVCLNEVVKEIIVLTAGRVKVHDLTQELGEIPLITCYRSKIGQILINLLVNASDAVDSKHKKDKEIGIFMRGEINIASRTQSSNGTDGVLVTISDSGRGVSNELRDKIFTQFFTTKAAGLGTGLGLAICDTIAREHGGTITVGDAVELRGAKFELWLPVEIQKT